MGSRIGSGSSSYSMKSTQFGSGSSGAHKGHHHKHAAGAETQGTTQTAAYTPGSIGTQGTGQYPSFSFNSNSQQTPQYPSILDPQSLSTTA